MKPIVVHSIVLQASTIAFYFFALDFLLSVNVKYAVILGALQFIILVSKALFLYEAEKEKILEYEEEAKKLEELMRKMDKENE